MGNISTNFTTEADAIRALSNPTIKWHSINIDKKSNTLLTLACEKKYEKAAIFIINKYSELDEKASIITISPAYKKMEDRSYLSLLSHRNKHSNKTALTIALDYQLHAVIDKLLNFTQYLCLDPVKILPHIINYIETIGSIHTAPSTLTKVLHLANDIKILGSVAYHFICQMTPKQASEEMLKKILDIINIDINTILITEKGERDTYLTLYVTKLNILTFPIIEKMISLGVDLNFKKNGMTAIMMMLHYGLKETVYRIVRENEIFRTDYDWSLTDGDGNTLLEHTVMRGTLGTFAELFSRYDFTNKIFSEKIYTLISKHKRQDIKDYLKHIGLAEPVAPIKAAPIDEKKLPPLSFKIDKAFLDIFYKTALAADNQEIIKKLSEAGLTPDSFPLNQTIELIP